jgi:hypothetical protein
VKPLGPKRTLRQLHRQLEIIKALDAVARAHQYVVTETHLVDDENRRVLLTTLANALALVIQAVKIAGEAR